MFERYTEKARRVIFFARYEASQFGSPYIETEHLLLGLLREDKALTNRFLRSHASVESIRKLIEGHTTIREKVSTSVDLPLSNECKRVLAYAAEFFFSSRRRHTRSLCDWSSDVCSSDLARGRDRSEQGATGELLLRQSNYERAIARSGLSKRRGEVYRNRDRVRISQVRVDPV